MRSRTSPVVTGIAAAIAIIISTALARAQGPTPAPRGMVIAGNVRFTVITPECIRIEEKTDLGAFVDQQSMFAANRDARFTAYTLQQTATSTTIDTGIIHLVYTPDGKPLGTTNLTAAIHNGAVSATWTPGAPNPGNLGGTVRTLDGWDGAGSLGQGLISRDGWYVIDDSHNDLLTKDWVQQRPATAGTDWYLFGYGDDYKGALKSLTAIGGPVPLPRKYLLGSWYSRYWPYNSADYRTIIGEYASHDFPIDNIVMDMDWHNDGWTGWSWNRKLLPDAEDLLTYFHSQGLHVTLNSHPASGVGPKEDAYAKFMTDMGEDPASGKTLAFDAGDKKYLDTMFADTHDPLMKNGVDFWWLDWQQYPFTKSVPDLTNLAWLNRYYYTYTSKNGQRGVSFSRWAGWGDHRYPIQFSGDASTSWKMLAFEVPMTSTAGNVGCFFWSHDIGGHNRGRNEESYTRWCQFGGLSAVLRSHSTRDKTMDRRPWMYADWAEDSMRKSFHLRSELFPYIYSSVAEASRDTVPLTRPLYIDYPGLEAAYHNGQEYLYGDNLLVAPITMPGVGPGHVGRQVVYFPPGTWYNTFTGERFVGPTEQVVSADINELPLYARGGVPIPMQPYSPRMTTAALTTVRVFCAPGPDGESEQSSLYEDDGVTDAYKSGTFASTPLAYRKQGAFVTVFVGPVKGSYKGQPASRAYSIELPDTRRPQSVTVDGKPAAFAYDAAKAETIVSVPARPITKSVTVCLSIPGGDFDYELPRVTAALRRGEGVLGMPLTNLNGNVVEDIAAIAAATPTAKVREAALAVCGIGVVNKSQAPYLYQGVQNLTFYAPTNVLDGNTFQKDPIESSAALPAPVAVTATPAILSTTASPDDPAAASGVNFTIGGQAVTLPDLGDLKGDIALTAKVKVSSVEGGYGFAGLTDGVVGGYPDNKKDEWSSGQTVGATCTLTWDKPQTIDRIRLFDRINLTDQITAGQILFSDGTTLPVGELPNDGATPFELTFPAKTVTSITFIVTAVKPLTESAGLAEFEVFTAGSTPK